MSTSTLNPVSNIITPHHLLSSPSLPLPFTVISFPGPPLSNAKSIKRSTLTTTRVAYGTKPTFELGEEEKAEEDRQIAGKWRALHGERNWKGLLEPMDPLLKSELIKYGDMTQACYDAFDYDRTSRFCGSCKYCPDTFFQDLGLPYTGYTVTRYLYATAANFASKFMLRTMQGKSWSLKANWIGYVAVSDDETTRRIGRRDIVVSWRGTVTRLEWVADLMNFLVPIPGKPEGVKVLCGFLDLYTEKERGCVCKYSHYSVREQVLAEIHRLVSHYGPKKEDLSITITGHSLGAALAVLSAYDIASRGINGKAPVSVISFAGPRVGNREFREELEAAGVKVLRVVNVHDTVPKVPGVVINEKVPRAIGWVTDKWMPWSYTHVGVELALDHEDSPFLRKTSDISAYHNLEAHLHLLDGYNGKGKTFLQTIGRDIALVNKSSGFLKDESFVPPYWRQDENKGMVRTLAGRWIQPERPLTSEYDPEIHNLLQAIEFASSNVDIED